MTDDIYEPLSFYRDELKKRHAENTANFFEELVKRSGVDEAANAATVAEINNLEKKSAANATKRSRLQNLRILMWIIFISGIVTVLIYLYGRYNHTPFFNWPWAVLSAILAALAIFTSITQLNPRIRGFSRVLSELQTQRNAKMAEARAQMAPLNDLYDWDMTARLIQQTMPRLIMDPFFNNGRLQELYTSFGLSERFNRNKSVIFAQSGAINGNPFVLAETLDFNMGQKVYTGSLTISWREQQTYTDSQGKVRTRWVTRYQTLHASVTKPFPEYSNHRFILYGNEAAPELTFSRTPSNLSHLGNGVLDKWRKGREIKKLEKFSRNLDDDSSFTIMANKEFDALFHAVDRDDEVQFRLLFTALAQQQMTQLLKDKTTGYGDNFTFLKERMINLIYPSHLANIDITTTPSLFHSHDLAAARKFFNDYNNDYFKSFFFAMAPLLTIPLYQQHRSHADIYKNVYNKLPSFWEHEAIANYYGQRYFSHADSATSNILKTEAQENRDGSQTVMVTAHSFRAVPRVEHVTKLGGDGHMHQVPVQWTEYLPVSRTSQLAVRDATGLTLQDFHGKVATNQDWQNFFHNWRADHNAGRFRRSIVSLLPKT